MIDRARAAIGQKIASLVLRAVVKIVNDSGGIQALQIVGLEGEERDEVERIQNYGLTSNPPPDSEAVALAVNGDRGHLLVVAVDHRGSRITGLLVGEAALYNGLTGKLVKVSADGTVHLGEEVLGSPDPVVRKSDLAALATKFNAHTHTFAANVTGGGGGSVAGTTGSGPTHTATGSSVVFSK